MLAIPQKRKTEDILLILSNTPISKHYNLGLDPCLNIQSKFHVKFHVIKRDMDPNSNMNYIEQKNSSVVPIWYFVLCQIYIVKFPTMFYFRNRLKSKHKNLFWKTMSSPNPESQPETKCCLKCRKKKDWKKSLVPWWIIYCRDCLDRVEWSSGHSKKEDTEIVCVWPWYPLIQFCTQGHNLLSHNHHTSESVNIMTDGIPRFHK